MFLLDHKRSLLSILSIAKVGKGIGNCLHSNTWFGVAEDTAVFHHSFDIDIYSSNYHTSAKEHYYTITLFWNKYWGIRKLVYQWLIFFHNYLIGIACWWSDITSTFTWRMDLYINTGTLHTMLAWSLVVSSGKDNLRIYRKFAIIINWQFDSKMIRYAKTYIYQADTTWKFWVERPPSSGTHLWKLFPS